MKLTVNKKTIDAAEGTTLAQLLEQQSIPSQGTAAALNNRVIPRAEYATTRLSEGDNILIIKAFYGG